MDRALLHKLLAIPESLSEPTYYQLLNINPLNITPELIRDALDARIQQMRRQIPGPQFLPVLAQFEKTLNTAAETLIDPEKRKAYHEQLKGHDESHVKHELNEEQREYLRRIRRIVQRALDEEGTLNPAKRPDLIETLRRMKVPEKDISYILAQIPQRQD